MKKSIALIAGILFSLSLWSQAGKDGTKTITTSGVIYNRYDTLISSASVGSSSFTVSNIANLSAAAIAGAANNPYATAALSYGDLLMIIKMQGASINTTNTSSYGTVTSQNNVGTYEIVVVRGIAGNTIFICGSLANNYVVNANERVQVVRIPRLSGLTINNTRSLTARAWGNTGNTGGIVAIEVSGNLVVNGSITTAGLGYRGGAIDNNANLPGFTGYVTAASADGGEKGEGTAGYQTTYDNLGGRYGRGAPGTGGGGGNAHNAGGGGGANAGNPASWNGMGNPSVSGGANWVTAWNLESAGFATNTSTGGGRGGYTYSANNVSPLTNGPGIATWGGDNRANVGGNGGQPVTPTSSTLLLGGGGGAGDANNSATNPGGNGGGIIYLAVTGTLSGTGSINANGNAGGSTTGGGNDAPAGGGAGGSIKLNVQGTISGVTVSANGGAGGNQTITGNEGEGPGGGGGGGFISIVGSPGITPSANGGSGGTTNSTPFASFTPNGATGGGTGVVSTGQTFAASPSLSCFVLPVHLISFTAQRNNANQALLNWTAELEQNLREYAVQTSNDGVNWRTAGITTARNSGNREQYQFNAGGIVRTTYYRLEIRNTDNSVSYSQIVILKQQSDATGYYVSGNKLQLFNLPASPLHIQLFNSLGAKVKEVQTDGNSDYTISLDGLSSGIYLIRDSNGNLIGKILR